MNNTSRPAKFPIRNIGIQTEYVALVTESLEDKPELLQPEDIFGDTDLVSTSVLDKPAIEYVNPVEHNGVKFYVSNDGKSVGLSQSGIARLVGGVSESSVRGILTALSANPKDRNLPLASALTPFEGQNPYLNISSRQQERVVRADIAAAIIEYYAFECRKPKEHAQQAFRQFAKIGIEAWIKSVTGYQESHELTPDAQASTNELLMALVSEMREVKQELNKSAGYRTAAQSMPGLVMLTDSYKPEAEHSQAYTKAQPEELYTLTEWLELSGYKLNLSEKHLLITNVKGFYESMHLAPPTQVQRRDINNMLKSAVAGYPRDKFPVLEAAYTQTKIAIARKKEDKRNKRKFISITGTI